MYGGTNVQKMMKGINGEGHNYRAGGAAHQDQVEEVTGLSNANRESCIVFILLFYLNKTGVLYRIIQFLSSPLFPPVPFSSLETPAKNVRFVI